MKPEIMSPAGSWVSLRSAIEAGADSVYFGVKDFNMRVNASNFEVGEIAKVVKTCHDAGVKAYLTLNTIVYDSELGKVGKVIQEVANCRVDGIIAWDMAILKNAQELGVPIMLSTQASVSNLEALKVYEGLGVKRVTLARELSLEQIKEIKKNTKMEIEVFVHGAMCVSVSGRCFISQFLFDRSANRGDCLQPCRRQYNVKDVETGDSLKLESNFVMSPKDLCTLPFLDKLVSLGVDAFKIEGRSRSPEYVKTVTSAYREAVDAISVGKFDEVLKKKLMEKVGQVYNRKFSSGFLLGKPTNADWTDIYGSNATREKVYVGKVKNYYAAVGAAEISVEGGSISVGDKIMIQGNSTGVFEQEVESLQIERKNVDTVSKGTKVAMKVGKQVRPNDKVFLFYKKQQPL